MLAQFSIKKVCLFFFVKPLLRHHQTLKIPTQKERFVSMFMGSQLIRLLLSDSGN